MAVVRCPKHNIPYNDRNPRGCPACHAERGGEEADAAIMRELARASRAMPAPPLEDPPRWPASPPDASRPSWPPPVTAPPRLPSRELRGFERLWRWVVDNRGIVGFAVALGIVGMLLWVITRPDFVPGWDPAFPTGDPLPVPVGVHTPVDGLFARLGSTAPTLNPDSPDLARYRYDGAVIDALNAVVYAVTLTTPARSWRGNRVGVSETLARSTLSLLGSPREEASGPSRAPVRVGGYEVYTTASDRPRRTLVAAVRPPNGCYDVRVELVPRIIGRLAQDDRQVVVVARRGEGMEWVVDRVRVVSRALPGPYAGRPECDPVMPGP